MLTSRHMIRPLALVSSLSLPLSLSLGVPVGCGGGGDTIGLTPLLDAGGGLDIAAGDVADTTSVECRIDADCVSKIEVRPCEVVRCRQDGRCALASAPDGRACEDGDACTGPDLCAAGACVAGPFRQGEPCDDGDPCTVDEVCGAGGCGGGVARSCDDGDACTEDRCEPSVGCVATPRQCPGGASACEVGVCDPATGACQVVALGDGEACDDGLDCTYGTTCQGGACVGFVAAECDDDNVCTVDLCTVEGCAHQAAAGSCDDGDPCTLHDRCAAGACVGDALPCSDGEVCTEDRCEEGECRFSPIEGCVPPSGGCDDKPIGAACDDGDPQTQADVCLEDGCAGFALTRIGGGASGEGRRFTHVGRVGEAWFAALAIDNAQDGAEGVLARVSLEGGVVVHPETRHQAAFTALHAGFAADAAGALWEFVDPDWSDVTPLALALAGTGAGTPRALWSYADGAGVSVWLVGQAPIASPWLRRCRADLPSGATCVSQSLAAADLSLPQAVTGTVSCDIMGCSLSLVTACDLLESIGPDGVPRYFNDVYTNAGDEASVWQIASLDPTASKATSRDVAQIAPGLYLAVGGYGYMRENTPLGLWGEPLDITEDQAELHFEGVWTGAGATLVVGWRAVGAGRELVMMVAPRLSDPADPSVWRRYALGVELGADGGLFDVWGDDLGRALLVGGGRSLDAAPGEALIFARRGASTQSL